MLSAFCKQWVALDPTGAKVPHQVRKRSNGASEVTFTPEAIGVHQVAVHFNNTQLSSAVCQEIVRDYSRKKGKTKD